MRTEQPSPANPSRALGAAPTSASGSACPAPRGRAKGVLAVLLCAHCTLTIGVGALALGTAALPTVFGVEPEWVVPPFFILGTFGIWLWWGRWSARRDQPPVARVAVDIALPAAAPETGDP